ncbi:hypothetical protein FSP39_019243 [Pinctada imbricata]|uniref:Vacuolar protein sorting-associated protein 41 homolog n=1 Tax=Pinctada imbricata TaxID=66713 RepID=A0AA88YLU2_PINIB|nr:hypothetical protein FSP39_019243 [Pinctada imbricata]
MEDEEEESTSSEEEEEETEPRLKYERIGNDLKNKILTRDCVSCLAVHPKFLAVGTHWGMIHIFDHAGNNVRDKEIAAHTTTVNQISIDDHGDYVASCSDDGKVMINGLYTSDNNQNITFDRPVKAVAIDPMFYKNSSRHFVTGDDKLILNERGFLNRHKTILLHQGEGPVREIQWKSDFIAWANDLGVKIFDMSSKKRITSIMKDHSYRPDLYQCSLCWKDNRTLLLAWADKVKVCVVKDKLQKDVRDLPDRYVEITAMFTLDSFVCGISPLREEILLLTFEKDDDENATSRAPSKRPHLKVVRPGMEFYDEMSNDALSVRGFEEYKSNDYHLEAIIDENLFYIVSPKDIIVSKERDQDDHIAWLLEHEDFEGAMELAERHEKSLRVHNKKDIAKQYLQYLLDDGQFEEAALQCPRILGKNRQLWEEEVYKFQKINQLRKFLEVVKSWPSHIYHVETVITVTLDKLDRDRANRTLLQALGELYSYTKQYDKSLAIYIKLRHKDVFTLIHKHSLFTSISDKITQLMEFDQEKAVQLLLDNMDKISIDEVVHQLRGTPQYLHIYLDKLFQKDPQIGNKFHGQQVKLYAEFDKQKLLPFLKGSNHYPLQMALEECELRKLIPEQVFLLGRMGNTKQALQLITSQLKDVDQAIEFCKEHNEPDLWEDLISFSIDKPVFIKGLLHNIGTHVDPIILISRIREGMEIPGLRDSLVKILQDYNLQMSLREGCKRILVADSFNLLDRLIKIQKRGISVDNSRYASNCVVFYCKHAFHEDCVPIHSLENHTCPICSTQRRGPGSKGAVTGK